jgi:hypothetical protein
MKKEIKLHTPQPSPSKALAKIKIKKTSYSDDLDKHFFFNQEEDNSTNIISLKTKKKKRTSIRSESKENHCIVCNKAYLSYAALYTHRRNKHNVIPITGRPEIFKLSFHKQKFHYTNKDEETEPFDVYKLLTSIRVEFLELAESQFSCFDSLFYIENKSERLKRLGENSFLKLLDCYLFNGNFSIEIPAPQEFGKSSVNNVLLIYSSLLLKIVTDDFFLKIMVKFIFFFREYLNISGWEYLKNLMKYNIIKIQDFTQEFCLVNSCWEIPHLVNDFVCVFIELNGLQPIKKEMMDVASNFCHWLLINNLTNLKLLPNNIQQ